MPAFVVVRIVPAVVGRVVFSAGEVHRQLKEVARDALEHHLLDAPEVVEPMGHRTLHGRAEGRRWVFLPHAIELADLARCSPAMALAKLLRERA